MDFSPGRWHAKHRRGPRLKRRKRPRTLLGQQSSWSIAHVRPEHASRKRGDIHAHAHLRAPQWSHFSGNNQHHLGRRHRDHRKSRESLCCTNIFNDAIKRNTNPIDGSAKTNPTTCPARAVGGRGLNNENKFANNTKYTVRDQQTNALHPEAELLHARNLAFLWQNGLIPAIQPARESLSGLTLRNPYNDVGRSVERF